MKKICQYCGTEKNVMTYVPSGCMCNICLRNLRNIKKYKLGIQTPRITKEMRIDKD